MSDKKEVVSAEYIYQEMLNCSRSSFFHKHCKHIKREGKIGVRVYFNLKSAMLYTDSLVDNSKEFKIIG